MKKMIKKIFTVTGCKSGGNIIRFISLFEKIEFKNTLKRLSEKSNITLDSALDSIIDDIVEQSTTISQEEKNDILINVSLSLSNILYLFLQKVEFSNEEKNMVENLYKYIDELVYSDNLNDLLEINDNIPNILKQKYAEYIKIQKNNEIKELQEIKMFKNGI